MEVSQQMRSLTKLITAVVLLFSIPFATHAAPGDVLSSFTINNTTGDGRTPLSPQGLVFYDGYLWVLDFGTDRIYRVYPETVFDTDGITVLHAAGDSDFNLPVPDASEPPTDSQGNPIPACGATPAPQYCTGGGLTFAGSFFWNASPITDDIIKLDPVDGDNLESENALSDLSFPSPSGITYDGQNFFIVDRQSNTINRVIPETGIVDGSFSGPSTLTPFDTDPNVQNAAPFGIAFDGVELWVSDQEEDTIYRVSKTDGSILASFASPSSSPKDLAWDGEFLWLADDGTDTIYKIDSGVIPIGVLGCLEKNGTPMSADALLRQDSQADQIQSLDDQGCFLFDNFASGVALDLTINETGVDEKPTITLVEVNNSVNVSVELGSTYVEPGFSANDPEDGDLTSSVVVVPDVVNNPSLIDTSVLNSDGIPITYDVVDSSGNTADTQTRLVFISPVSYSVGGSLSGLNSGNSISLTNNGGDEITLSADGSFTFNEEIVGGLTYGVAISQQPVGQNCTITNGAGTITADVANVLVNCSDITYTLNIDASGLETGDALVVSNNAVNSTITTNDVTTIETVIYNTFYDIQIVTPPDNKTCAVSDRSDETSGNALADITVSIECAYITYTLGGTVSGLEAGDTPALRLEFDAQLTTITADGSYTLVNTINSGSSYSISINQSPTNKNCTLSNETGSATADVTNIDVSCIDNIPPDTPTVDVLYTNNPSPTLSGTANIETGDSLTVVVNGATYNNIGGTGGSWSLDLANATPNSGSFSPLNDGVYDVALTLSDSVGNQSADLTIDELNIDTVAPITPTVNSIITNVVPPGPLTGTATISAGETLSVEVNGAVFENVSVSANAWSIDLNTDAPTTGTLGTFIDGNTYDVIATARDLAGNTAVDQTGLEITIDQSAPSAPPAPDLLAISDTGASDSDNITASVTPDFYGACVDGEVVNLYIDSVNSGVSDTCASSTYSLTAPNSLSDGAHSIAVSVTDGAGNEGPTSTTPLAIIVDTIAPTAPVVTTLVTNDTSPSLSGTANLLSGETLSLTLNGLSYSALTVTASNWALNTETTAPDTGSFVLLSDAVYDIQLTATDLAGNATNDLTSGELTIDTVAPNAPVVNLQTTNDTTPTISGSATLAAGETLSVSVNGATYADVPTNSNIWNIDTGLLTPTSGVLGVFTDGSSYEVVATITDAASNATNDISANELSIDTTAPLAPTVDTVITNDTSPTISGTAILGSGETLEVRVNGGTFRSVTTSSNIWNIDTGTVSPDSGTLGAFSDGTSYEITAVITDAASLSTSDVTSNELTIDLTAPAALTAPDMASATDRGTSDTDDITSDNTPTFEGACTNDDTVTLYVDSTVTTATALCTGGSYSLTATNTMADGARTVTVTATDPAGNEGPEGTGLSIQIDTSAPTAPGQPDLSAASDSGASDSDNVTGVTRPEFQGTCTDGETIEILINSISTGDQSLCATSTYSITLSNDLNNGTYAISSRASDIAGNLSSASTALSITIDTTAADAPAAPDMTAATDTGRSSDDNITADNTPTFAGACTNGDTISLYVDGTATGDTVTCSSEAYTITAVTNLADDSYSITATATGSSGVESPQSLTLNITVDTTTPTAPSAPDLSSGSDTGSSNADNITAETFPTMTGTCTNDETITLYIDGIATSGTDLCQAGTFAINSPTALTSQDYDLTITSTDAAGNQSTQSPALTITVDTIAPSAPSTPDLTNATDSGDSNSDNITNISLPSFEGSCTSGEVIELYVDSLSTNQSSVCTGATYSLSTVDALTNGSHDIAVRAIDTAGNTSSLSSPLTITIDTGAPLAPSVQSQTTNNTSPTLTGTASLGSGESLQVQINSSVYSNVTVTAGNWSLDTTTETPTSGSSFSALADGTYSIEATTIDLAGNTASDTTSDELTIDTVAPAAPGIPDLTSVSDTGTSDSDNITNSVLPSFTGSCTDNETISLYADGIATGATSICASAVYTVQTLSDLTSGNVAITVTSTDEAGNQSAESLALSVVVDTTAPAAPTVNTVTTNDTSPTISGTASLSSGDSLAVSINGAQYDDVTVSGGSWTIDLGTAIPSSGSLGTFVDTTYNVNAVVTDIAGNQAPDATSGELTIDTTPPSVLAVPDMTAASDTGASDADNITQDLTPVFTGSCTDGDLVQLYIDGSINNSVTCATASYSVAANTLSEGTLAVTVTSTDPVGNESAQSLVLSTIIDTTAPAAPSALDLTDISDSGLSNTDNITNVAAPSFSAACTINETLTFYLDSVQNGANSVCTSGNANFTTVSSLTDGPHSASFTTTDLAGNTSAQSVALSLTIDTTAPGQPLATDLSPSSDTGLSDSDNITSDTTPEFVGACTNGERISLYIDNSLTTANTICASATYSLVSPATLLDGGYAASVTVTDVAGNESTPSTGLAITVDTTAPSAPSVDSSLTNDTTPVLTGQATLGTGDELDVVINGATYTNIGVTGNAWSLDTGTVAPSAGTLNSFIDGAYDVTATIRDAAGNSVNDATLNELTIDTTPPSAPVSPDMTDATDTGSSTADNVTTIANPDFIGACNNNDTISLYIDGSVSSASQVCANNQYALTAPSALSEGNHAITVTATDPAGNEGTESPALQITIDLTAPAAPGAPDLAESSDTGTSPSDNVTSATLPEFSGACTNGTTLTLYLNGGQTDAAACIGGSYSVTSVTTLGDGDYTATVTARDLAGNESASSAGLTITIDTATPAAPSAPDLEAASDTGSSDADNITNDSTPSFVGSCTTGETMTLYVGGVSTNTNAVCSAGSYSITQPSNLSNANADGTSYQFTVTTTSLAGIVGTQSPSLQVTFDNVAPTASTPDLISSSDSGTSDIDDLTNDATPSFSGACAAGELATLFVDNAATAETSNCSVSNSYTVTSSTDLTDGTRAISVTLSDIAGNTSAIAAPALSVVIDTNAPSAPSTAPDLIDSSDTGTSNSDNNTSDNTPTFAGSCSDDSIVTLYVDGVKTSSTSVCTSSTYSVTSSDVLSNASHDISVSYTDAAGNESTAQSPILSINVDNGKPNSPSEPDLDTGSDSGISASDNVTQDSTPTFSGTCVAGSTVTLVVDGTSTADTAICQNDSSYNITSSVLADGSYAVAALITSLSGIDSDPSSALNIVIDNVAAPVQAPDLLAGSDTGSSNTDNVTSDSSPTFGGVCANDEQITLLIDSAVNSSPAAITCASGTYNALTVATSLNDQQGYIVQIRNTDLAGNVSVSPAMNPALIVDTSLPTAPTVSSTTFNSLPITVSGSATLLSGETLSVEINGATYDDVAVVGGNWAVNLGTTAPDQGTLGQFSDDTSYPVTATIVDSAGNSQNGVGTIQIDNEVAVSFSVSGFGGTQPIILAESNTGGNTSISANGLSTAYKVPHNEAYSFSVTQHPTDQGCWFPASAQVPQTTINGSSTTDITIDVVCDDLTKAFASTDTVTITEGGANTSNLEFTTTLVVSDSRQIADLNVSFDLAHEYPGDITVQLTSPAGTNIFLIERPGTNALSTAPGQQGSQGGWGCNNDAGTNSGAFNVVLDDEATGGSIEGQCNPISGTYTPSPGALSSFDGESSNGTWTLTILDSYASADGGSLANWNLVVTYPQ